MAEPTSHAEYLARFFKNQRVSGQGIDGTTMHLPCPFCAAPDFMVSRVVETSEAIEKGGECKECGRSAKGIVQRAPGSVSFALYQTGGPDQPEWLEPKMPRLPPEAPKPPST